MGNMGGLINIILFTLVLIPLSLKSIVHVYLGCNYILISMHTSFVLLLWELSLPLIALTQPWTTPCSH